MSEIPDSVYDSIGNIPEYRRKEEIEELVGAFGYKLSSANDYSVEELKDKIEELEGDNDNLRDEINDLEYEISELKDKVESLED